MNTIELAEQADLDWQRGFDLDGVNRYETFARLVIEDFVKGLDVEPAFIWHDNKEDECDNEMFEVAQVGRVDISDIYEGGICPHCTPLYTAEQMAAVRHKALEEAAKVCEELWHIDGTITAEMFAAAIRALKEKA